eukprot:12756217-Alexandrium_andersonii.AAC.1
MSTTLAWLALGLREGSLTTSSPDGGVRNEAPAGMRHAGHGHTHTSCAPLRTCMRNQQQTSKLEIRRAHLEHACVRL